MPDSPHAPIDRAAYQELQDTAGKEFIAELLDTFFEEAPQMLAELRAARAASDAERFRRAAHSLKSNASTFGASAMAMLARALELNGLDADAARDALAIDRLEAAYAKAAAALKGLQHG
jgi:HPt (histidine-containing phosphotransfer) domain-containing protein